MLHKLPDSRLSIINVVHHPIVNKIGTLLQSSHLIEERTRAEGEVIEDLPILGAILPQHDQWIYEIFHDVYNHDAGVESVDDSDSQMDIDE